MQGCGIVEDSIKIYHKCQSLCQIIHGLNDKAQQMDETKKRAVVGWRRQGIPIRSQLLTVVAAFNRPGCCPVVLCCEIHKRQEERLEGGQISFMLAGMNTEVMTMTEYLPEIGQEEEMVSAQILPFFSCFWEHMAPA